jgi:hypothetical protein
MKKTFTSSGPPVKLLETKAAKKFSTHCVGAIGEVVV